MTDQSIQLPHKLTLNGRKVLTVTGVSEVISFDDQSVILHTAMGILSVHGQELQLKSLSPEGGQVIINGTVAALIYEEPKPDRGWFRRRKS